MGQFSKILLAIGNAHTVLQRALDCGSLPFTCKANMLTTWLKVWTLVASGSLYDQGPLYSILTIQDFVRKDTSIEQPLCVLLNNPVFFTIMVPI